MAISVRTYIGDWNAGAFSWSGGLYMAGNWLVTIHCLPVGSLQDMDPPGAGWILLGQAVDPGGPVIRVWAYQVQVDGDVRVGVSCPPGAQVHSYLYELSGLRSSNNAESLFSVGAAAGPAALSQSAPLYAPDDSGLLIATWLSAGLCNYTLPGGVTPRAEVDASASTSRSGEQTIATHGPSTRTATASAAKPWAAVTVVARDATGSVTFPNQSLAVRTEIAPGGSPDADPATWAGLWTDITPDGYARNPITITRGRQDEASSVGPSSMSLELNNSGGKYTRLNPTGPYYGKLSKNTPIRLWVDPGSGWDLRYTGFVSEWPPRQQGGNVDQSMPITASGVLRRMNQGKALRSALYRAITAKGGFSAYWPLETDPSNGVVGGLPMRTLGPSSFGSDGPAGSAGAMSFDSGGTASGTVVGMPNVGGWRVSWWVDIPADFDAANDYSVMVNWYTPGATADQWFAYVPAGQGGKIALESFQLGVSENAVVGDIDLRGKGPTLITASATQNGANVTMQIVYQNADFNSGIGTDYGPDTVMPITNIGINLGQWANDNPTPKGRIDHLLVVPDSDAATADMSWLVTAGTGYTGERAADRIRRISAEEGVPVVVVGDDGTSEPMGPQPIAKLLDVLRDCETADGGMLYERRDGRLAYQVHSGRYNATPALTLDNNQGHLAPPFEPIDDDQATRNDVTASRPDGGAARIVDTGSIDTVGLYDGQITVNVAADDQLDDQAGWRVHLGTNEDYRFPSISPNLNGRALALIPGWLALDVCQAVAVTNPPQDLPPGQIDTFCEGYTEAIDTVSWTATVNASPGKPWKVAVLDDLILGHLDTDGSQLAAGVTATATSLSVATTSGPIWTTNPADLPIDIIVGGEVMTVTAITGSSSPQTFTVTRSTNGISKSHSADEDVRLAQPMILAL